MGDRRARHLGISDAMILIAAFAAGLGLSRANFGEQAGWDWSQVVQRYGAGIVPTSALALFALSLKDRSVGRRRLARRPGLVACGAILASYAVIYVKDVTYSACFHWNASGGKLPSPWVLVPKLGLPFDALSHVVPAAIASSWLLLSLSGRWRFGGDIIDRLGIILGIYALTWELTTYMLPGYGWY